MFTKFNLSHLAEIIKEQGFPIEEIKASIREDTFIEELPTYQNINLQNTIKYSKPQIF